jgi:3-(3-hydroxy-phenyl)propionate hydroxylase
MCAGIRDAANLAWKLADVQRGTASESLLDTYETERSPHVREFIETAVRLGSVIQTTDPQAARDRDARMLAQPTAFTTPQPRLGPGAYPDADPAAPDADGPAGTIGEQPLLADGVRLDDRVGYRHALVVAPALAAAARLAAGDRAEVLEALPDGEADRWLQRLGAAAVLLRPDRYVAGVAADEASLRTLVDRHFAAARQAPPDA